MQICIYCGEPKQYWKLSCCGENHFEEEEMTNEEIEKKMGCKTVLKVMRELEADDRIARRAEWKNAAYVVFIVTLAFLVIAMTFVVIALTT